jgi:hypothetical protein
MPSTFVRRAFTLLNSLLYRMMPLALGSALLRGSVKWHFPNPSLSSHISLNKPIIRHLQTTYGRQRGNANLM